jgi:multicomponent Na+:H+ antiporter subunit C
MNDILCWLIGGLISISLYQMLSQQLIRWLFGIVILSSTINLVILVSGRLNSDNPAFIPQGESTVSTLLANPLSQALILTSIVIGFGLLSFALVLLRRVWRTFGTTNLDSMRYSEKKYLAKEEEA